MQNVIYCSFALWLPYFAYTTAKYMPICFILNYIEDISKRHFFWKVKTYGYKETFCVCYDKDICWDNLLIFLR